MKKLSLDPDQLRVQTFSPERGRNAERGTVLARSTDNIRWCSQTYCQECSNWSCGGETCEGVWC
jgi:hypothetical protein